MKPRLFSLLILLGILLSACQFSLAEDITPPPGYQSPTPAPTMGPLYPAQPPSLENGAAIFVEKCAPCHGVAGLGNGPRAAQLPGPVPALGLAEIANSAIPADWFIAVTQGNIEKLMPPFISLSEQERWDVVAYALSLSITPETRAQGEAVYLSTCAGCHTEAGVSLTDPQKMAKLSINDMIRFAQKGIDPTMPGFEGQLDDADLYAVSAYERTLIFAAPQPTATPEPTAAPIPDTATPAATTTDLTPIAATDVTPAATDATPVATVETSPTAEGSATPSGLGTVTGQLKNGSGGSIPVDLKVTLTGFDHDTSTGQFAQTVTLETTAAADGSFKFENVELTTGRALVVTLEYAGATYNSDVASVDGTTTEFDLPVTFYETTTDASALVVEQAHILFDMSKPGVTQVLEFLIVTNPGTKTVVAAEGEPVLTVALPKDATNLQFQDGQIGDRYMITADGFGDTAAIPPSTGQYQLVFAFDLLYTGELEFNQLVKTPITSMNVLAPQGVTVAGANFISAGPQDIGTAGTFEMFTAHGFNVGDTIAFTVSGQPQAEGAAATGTDSTQMILIGVGVFGLALILAGVYLYWRDRNRGDADDDEADADDEEEDADDLMDAIIALDDQYRSGNLSAEAYQQRRAELKERLKNVM
jgi:mono/diheme cytochrome c family protein